MGKSRKPIILDEWEMQEIPDLDTLDPKTLGTGTRNGNRFLRDDGTWADVPTGTSQGSGGGKVIYGNVAPTPDIGSDGDSYVDSVAHKWYGPKANGSWPPGWSMGSSGTTQSSNIPLYTMATLVESAASVSANAISLSMLTPTLGLSLVVG